jgi:hypothetical protein
LVGVDLPCNSQGSLFGRYQANLGLIDANQDGSERGEMGLGEIRRMPLFFLQSEAKQRLQMLTPGNPIFGL